MPTTLYVWDVENDSLIEELDGSGNSIVTYTQTPNQFGGTISEDRGGSTSYYHYDGLGSTLALSNQSGVVTDEYSYSAYGEVVASSGSTTNPFKYVGKYGYYTDSETNDIYIRARTYQPTVARWCSRDPIGFNGSKWNLFEFVGSRALGTMDPSDLRCCLRTWYGGITNWGSHSALDCGPGAYYSMYGGGPHTSEQDIDPAVPYVESCSDCLDENAIALRWQEIKNKRWEYESTNCAWFTWQLIEAGQTSIKECQKKLKCPCPLTLHCEDRCRKGTGVFYHPAGTRKYFECLSNNNCDSWEPQCIPSNLETL